jgi:hypothetical protein
MPMRRCAAFRKRVPLILVLCWALPGAAFCALFWLASPVALLVAGISELSATTVGWRWPMIWTGIVIAGLALDPLVLWAATTNYSGGGFEPAWLACSFLYLVAGAALAFVLIGAPQVRAHQSPHQTG